MRACRHQLFARAGSGKGMHEHSSKGRGAGVSHGARAGSTTSTCASNSTCVGALVCLRAGLL